MCTFRVLSAYDEENLSNNENIIAKNPLDGEIKMLEAFKQVGCHTQCGSNFDFAWISTSSSLKTAMDHYDVPYSKNKNNKRNRIAVMTGLDKTNFTTKEGRICDMDTQIKNMGPVVLDLSNDVSRKNIAKEGFLIKKNGEKYNKPSSIGPGLKYARKSNEIIVLNKIDKEHIVRILNPVEMDLLYALEAENYNMDSIISTVTNVNIDGLFTELETIFYRELFTNKKFLCDIVDDIMKENDLITIKYNKDFSSPFDLQDKANMASFVNTNIDVLNIYAYARETKRTIIKKLLVRLGYQITRPRIVDDNIHILRVGRIGETSFFGPAALKYNNIPFELPCIHEEHNYICFDDSSNHKTLAYCYIYDTESFSDENFYWLESGCDEPFITNGKELDNSDSLCKKLVKNEIITR